MAGQDKRIIDLTPISAGQIASGDVLPIVDLSAFETKKVSFIELKDRITEDVAPKNSPNFTGEPTAPTVAPISDSSTKIATTAFVQNALSNVTVEDATTTVKGKLRLSGDLSGTADTPTVPGLLLKAPLASPALTGTPTAPTVSDNNDNTNKIATTGFVQSALANASVPDATTTEKGKIKLAGDLSGTADMPIVPELLNKVTGPSNSGDERLVRFDGTSGKIVKNSGVILDSSDRMSGLQSVTTSELNIDLIRVGEVIDTGATGENVMIAASASRIILTNSSLVSVAGISSPSNGKYTTVVNKTGNPLTFIHDYSSFLVDNRFILPDSQNIILRPDDSLTFIRSASYGSHILEGGGGSGDGSKTLETLMQLTADESVSDWSVLIGGFDISKVDPIQGDASYVLNMGAAKSAIHKGIPVDPAFRGKWLALTFNYELPSGVARVLLLDQANTYIEGSSFDIPAVNGLEKFGAQVFIPPHVTLLKFEVVSTVDLPAASFKFDNVQLSSALLNSVDIEDKTQALTGSSVSGLIVNLENGLSRGNSTLFSVSGNTLTALVPCEVFVSLSVVGTSGGANDVLSVGISGTSPIRGEDLGRSATGLSIRATTAGNSILNPGEIVVLSTGSSGSPASTSHSYTILATARTKSIVAPTDIVTEKTIAFRWRSPAQATEANLSATGQIGDYVTGQYSTANALSQCTTRPTQADADMSINGPRIYTRAYNAASTAALPTKIVIKIAEPNQMAACDVKIFNNIARELAAGTPYVPGSGGSAFGFFVDEFFNPATGLLTFDAGLMPSTNTSNHNFVFTNNSTQNDGYITFTASKLAQGVAIPKTNPVAIIKDVKSSGTGGGAAVATAWTNRVLNTIEDRYSIVKSLSGNSFVLPRGTYTLECISPFGVTGSAVASTRLRDTSGSVTLASGSAVASYGGSSPTGGVSVICSILNLSQDTPIALQYYSSASAASGLGIALGAVGEPEIYTQVKITKLD